MRFFLLAVALAASTPAFAQTSPVPAPQPPAAVAPVPAPPRTVGVPGAVAVLRGLDKVTGLYRDFNAPIGKPVKFHTLDIVARSCQKSSPEDPPETAVFMEVVDTPLPKKGAPPPSSSKIFSGWIFGSTPALNALEHPVYDVWAIGCR